MPTRTSASPPSPDDLSNQIVVLAPRGTGGLGRGDSADRSAGIGRHGSIGAALGSGAGSASISRAVDGARRRRPGSRAPRGSRVSSHVDRGPSPRSRESGLRSSLLVQAPLPPSRLGLRHRHRVPRSARTHCRSPPVAVGRRSRRRRDAAREPCQWPISVARPSNSAVPSHRFRTDVSHTSWSSPPTSRDHPAIVDMGVRLQRSGFPDASTARAMRRVLVR